MYKMLLKYIYIITMYFIKIIIILKYIYTLSQYFNNILYM
jgi:hypothetical protein